MKKYLLIALFLFFATSNAWGYVTKKEGILLDIESKEPVPYAHLVVLNTEFATTSNENGEFVLRYSNKKDLELRISCIGFKTVITNLNDIKNVVYLEKQTYELDEVIVKANKPSAQDYVAKAFSKIKGNYIVSNHLLTGYFMEGEYDGSSPIYIAEGIVEAKLPTQNDLYPYRKIRYLQDGRKKVYQNPSKHNLKIKASGAKRALKYSMTDPINAMFPSHFLEYEYKIKGFENYNGREVVVISFGNNARLAVYGLFFIDLKTYAFIRLEGNQLHGDGGPFDNWKWKHHKWVEEYKQNNKGLYYLEASLYVGNWINKKRKQEYEMRSLFITDKIEQAKGFSRESWELPKKAPFLLSIKNSNENFLDKMGVENLNLVKKRMLKGIPKYTNFKRPYRK